MARKNEYEIVGRYMDGKEVTGYHVRELSSGDTKRLTREQIAFLVGKGQITNCTGRLYQDKVLLEGVGISLNDLPVKQERVKSDNNQGQVDKDSQAKSADNADIKSGYNLIYSIVDDKDSRRVVGYGIIDSKNSSRNLAKDKTIQLIKIGRVLNARIQEYNGKVLIRGVGVNLSDLPTIKASKLKENTNIVIDRIMKPAVQV